MKWKQSKIIRWMVLAAMLLTSIPITAFAQMYSGTCIVTVGSKGHGTISPDGELSVWPGERLTFEMTPDEGYEISSVSVNGVRLTDAELEEVIQTESYSLTGIYSNTSMEVVFCAKASSSQHTYTVIGSETVCGSWQDPTAVWNDMRETETGKFEAVYSNVAAGYYEFWVAQDHGWTTLYGRGGTQDALGVQVLKDGATLRLLFDESTGSVSVEQSLNVEETESATYIGIEESDSADWAEEIDAIEEATLGDAEIAGTAQEIYSESQADSRVRSVMDSAESIEQSASADSQGYRQVTVGYSSGGAVTPPATAWITEQGVIQVPEGETAFFSFLPAYGYQVKDIYIDGTILTGTDKETAIADGGFLFWDTTRDRSIYVEFEPSEQSGGEYSVSVSFTGNGWVEPTPGLTTTEDGVVYVPQGQSLSLFLYPYDGYEVQEILVDGVAVSEGELQSAKSTNSFTLWEVQANHTISVSFGEKESVEQAEISLTAGEGGTIYTSDWTQGVTNGTTIVQTTAGGSFGVFIVPDSGWKISQVLIDGGSISAEQLEEIKTTQSYQLDAVEGNRSVQVIFSRDFYQISFSSGIGGSIQPILEASDQESGILQAQAGSDVPFQIIPDQGYELAGLTIDGTAIGEEELEDLKTTLSYTFYQVSSDHEIMAAFLKKEEEKSYAVTSSAGGHGSITPLGQQKVTAGQSITFGIVPDEGYEISAVLVDGEAVSQITLRRAREKKSFTFQPIHANHTIAVEFAEKSQEEKKNYQIYYCDEDGEEIEELSGVYQEASEYVYGTGITLPVQAPYTKEGYAFEGWYDSQEGGNQVTVISSKEKGDKTVYARWKKRAAGSSQTTLENEWYGITVNGFFTALPELKVEQIQKGNTTYDSLCKRSEMSGKVALAGYKLSVSGGEPDGTLKVSFLLDEKLDGEEVTVLQLTGNGTLHDYTAKVESGTVSVQADELGTFVMGMDSAAVKKSGVKEIHGVAIEEEEETKKDGMGILFLGIAAILLIGVCVTVGIITKKKIDNE